MQIPIEVKLCGANLTDTMSVINRLVLKITPME